MLSSRSNYSKSSPICVGLLFPVEVILKLQQKFLDFFNFLLHYSTHGGIMSAVPGRGGMTHEN